MHIPSPVKYGIAAVSLAGAALMPTLASAQTPPSNMPEAKWQFSASIYAYLPTLSGNTTFPGLPGSPSSSMSVDAGTIIDNLKMVFMGSLDMHNGQWGLWNDVMYMNIGNSKSGTRDFSLINGIIPASATADLSLDIKGTIWTVAGEYRLYNVDPAWTNDLLFGARMFNMTNTLGYSFLRNRWAAPAGGALWHGRGQRDTLGRHHRRQGQVRLRRQPRVVRALLPRRGHRPVAVDLAGRRRRRLPVRLG